MGRLSVVFPGRDVWGFVGFLRALGLQCSISGLLSSNQPAEMLCESVGSSASCCSYCISCSSPVVKVFLLRSHLTSLPPNLVLEVGGLLGWRGMPGPFRKRAFVHHYVGEGPGVDFLFESRF